MASTPSSINTTTCGDSLIAYQLVKDLRNKTESTNPLSVLDGNIDQFIEEGIKNK